MKPTFTAFIGILSLSLTLTTNTLQAQVRTKRFSQTQDLSAFGIASSSVNKQAAPTLSLSAIDPGRTKQKPNREDLFGLA